MQHLPAQLREEAATLAGSSITAGHVCLRGSLPRL